MSDIVQHPLTNRPTDDIVARRKGAEVHVGEFVGRASWLSEHLPDQPYVINLCRDRYEFLLGFCAAVIAGQCTLMPPNRQRQTLLSIANDHKGTYILGRDRVKGIEFAPMDVTRGLEVTRDIPLITDDQLCAIAFTSGSTGESKPNRKYWRTLRSGTASNIGLLLDVHDSTINVVATVPPQHMWGLEMSIMLPLLSNVATCAETPFFPQDILDTLDALPHPRALVSSPVHLEALIKASTGRTQIDRIYTATSPMSVEIAKQLEEEFASQVIDVFGCSESGIIAARRPTVMTEWQLADAFTLEGTENGTMILADYLDEPVLLNDRVELLRDRRFIWIGRDEDMVNIAGKRASLAALNRHLISLPHVEDGVIFMPDSDAKRLAALVVAPGLQRSDILDGLREIVDPAFLPRPVRMVPALPRQETGKLSRRAILDLYASLGQEAKAATNDNDKQAKAD
jgi:acyl-coenzyme A synthetase/AMP-(fatty) acid ligase